MKEGTERGRTQGRKEGRKGGWREGNLEEEKFKERRNVQHFEEETKREREGGRVEGTKE